MRLRTIHLASSDFSRVRGMRVSAIVAPVCWVLAVVIVVFAFCPLMATTVEPPDFATLVADADVVFTGEVAEIRAKWVGESAQRHIESFVTFRVLRTMKGSPGETFVLNQVGGTLDNRTLEIAGAPKWITGDRAILFVENNGTQVVPLVGLMYGRFPLRKDGGTGKEVAFRFDGAPLRDTAEIDEIHVRGAFAEPAHGTAKRKETPEKKVDKGMIREDFESAIEGEAKRGLNNP